MYSSSCGWMPRPDRQCALRVEVHQQHAAAVLGQRGAQVDRRGGLADPALLVADRDDPGRTVAAAAARGRESLAAAARWAR